MNKSFEHKNARSQRKSVPTLRDLVPFDCLEKNEKAGIVYHREGIMGDYDEFDDLEELIDFIKTGR